jgi:2-haloacid dehalogenase
MPERLSHDRRRIIVFDVNETLLDIEALTPLFERLFGDGRALREWFAQLILYSEAITLAGTYEPFGQLGAGVLRMVGETKGVEVHEPDLDELRSRMQAMPAHPEVPAALAHLREAGLRLVTLTNSAPQPEGGPLERAGIASFFERQFSVDQVGRYKPALETYRLVAQALEVGTDELWVVACHTWDTIGAQRAGCAGAFVQRPGNALLPLPGLPQPDVVGPDLLVVAERIIAACGAGA